MNKNRSLKSRDIVLLLKLLSSFFVPGWDGMRWKVPWQFGKMAASAWHTTSHNLQKNMNTEKSLILIFHPKIN